MSRSIFTLVLGSIAATLTAEAVAADSPTDFLKALKEAGYGDTAIEYMQLLEKGQLVPAELKDTWDLEYSQSYLSAAKSAYNDKEADKFNDLAKVHLNKFRKEKPTHPDISRALLSFAQLSVDQGLQMMRAVKLSKDKEQIAKFQEDARKLFIEAKPLLKQSHDALKVKAAALPPLPAPPAKSTKAQLTQRAQVLEDYLDSRFWVSLNDYYVATTFSDPKAKERVDLLTAAVKEFNAIFQANRDNKFGLAAKMWEGKCHQELGNIPKTLDIYDEVLAYGTDPREVNKNTQLNPVIAQVELLNQQLMFKQGKVPEYLAISAEWVAAYSKFPNLKNTSSFQSIAFERAKNLLALAPKQKAADKTKYEAEAKKLLADIAKIRGDDQPAIILLLKELGGGGGAAGIATAEPDKLKTFDEALTFGGQAEASSEWANAVAFYKRAIALADPKKDAEQLPKVKAAHAKASYFVAKDLAANNKLPEAYELAMKTLSDPAVGEVGPSVGVIAVNVALMELAKVPREPAPAYAAALEKVQQSAELVIKGWPARPEADAARVATGQALASAGRVDESLDLLEKVNPRSEHYGMAMYHAGRFRWVLYAQEKGKPEASRKADVMAKNRAAALENLTKCFDQFKGNADAQKAHQREWLDVQRLLGIAHQDGGDLDKAVTFFQPLIDAVGEGKAEQIDRNMIGVFTLTVRAYLSRNDIAKAGEVGKKLFGGEDSAEVNTVLVEFARTVDLERKKASGKLIEANPAEQPAIQKQLEATQKVLGDLLTELAKREKLTLAGLIFIADSYNGMNQINEAEASYQKIVKRGEDNAEFKEEMEKKKADTWVQTQLIAILRKQEKYEEALKQAKLLAEKYKNAISPQMEVARIQQAWAEKQPIHFDEAVKEWAALRKKLAPLKQRPPEYYEVIFNQANCMIMQAEKEKSQAKAADAERLLTFTRLEAPQLDGPETQAKFNVLLAKAVKLQGRKPAEPKKPDGDGT